MDEPSPVAVASNVKTVLKPSKIRNPPISGGFLIFTDSIKIAPVPVLCGILSTDPLSSRFLFNDVNHGVSKFHFVFWVGFDFVLINVGFKDFGVHII